MTAKKEQAVARLQELEDEQRIDAVQRREEGDEFSRSIALAKADAFALSRDVVQGVWF